MTLGDFMVEWDAACEGGVWIHRVVGWVWIQDQSSSGRRCWSWTVHTYTEVSHARKRLRSIAGYARASWAAQ